MNSDATLPVKIAIADDDPATLAIFSRLLEALGHQVVCMANNGEELVSACRNHEVDLAFTDLEMPVMDGLAAAEHLATLGIPVVLVSGHPDSHQIVLQSEPIASLIFKPATKDMLQAAIRKAMNSNGSDAH
jgi:CheY-like chemotaxis protein